MSFNKTSGVPSFIADMHVELSGAYVETYSFSVLVEVADGRSHSKSVGVVVGEPNHGLAVSTRHSPH